MTAEVVELDVVTRLDVPVEKILRRATEATLDVVVVIGYDADGDLYFASSVPAGPEVLWLMELAKKRLMEVGDGEE